MAARTKLELTWIGKDERPRLEPRILLEDPAFSYHAKTRRTEEDRFENILVFGDNLLALKALESKFAGKFKCIYIDPPYNTGVAFAQYDDSVEHSLWLSLLRDRLELLRRLLSPDGAFFCSIDDTEAHYLKVLADEVFGRSNFITNFVWQKVDSPNDNKVPITPDHEFILCYANDSKKVRFKPKNDPSVLNAFSSRDESGRLYRDRLLKKNGRSSLRSDRPSMWYAIRGPDGVDVYPVHDDGREACWSLGKKAVSALIRQSNLIWKNRGTEAEPRWVPYTREYAPTTPTRPYPTIWTDAQTMRQAKAHQKLLLGPQVEVFATPKPEPLMMRIIEMCTEVDDLVLDSTAGSGTTGSVAHKLGRRWVMIERGEHCHTHVIPRLRKVIDGEDPGGVTEATGWQGGGGFRYYKLAPSLLEKDRFDNWVVSKKYNAAMLAEALCKLEGFTYAPSDTLYWQHGRSTESDFAYVTTQTLSADQLQALSDEVGPKRTLLVLCSAFRAADPGRWPNLTLKKIPKAVLNRCEWGRDDYSLAIRELPQAEPEPPAPPARRKGRAKARSEASLFDPSAGETP